MEGKVFTMDDAQMLARHMMPITDKMEKYMEEYIELKAQILAIKSYIGSERYIGSKALKQILGMEITEEDD